MTEREFQRSVIELANLLGWRVAHFRPARTKHGWATPVSADGKGFPDLILVRGDRVIAAELKSDRGRLTIDQQGWLDAFEGTPVEVHVWRPEDWDDIQRVLGRTRVAAA